MTNSRFTLTETPALLPGECWITNSSVGPFIDTHLDVPFEKRGRVYISLDVVREMAFEAGLFEGLVPNTAVTEAYANGRADGIKENLNGNLDRIVSELVGAAGTLSDVLAHSPAPVEPAQD